MGPTKRISQGWKSPASLLLFVAWFVSFAFVPMQLQSSAAPKDGVNEPRIVKFSVRVSSKLAAYQDEFVDAVKTSLFDPRGWLHVANVRFQNAPSGEADVRIILGTPDEVDRYCFPLRTNQYFSCRNGRTIAINSNRFILGARRWTAELDRYRIYVINHEMGHFLGYGHQGCTAGNLAPVMMQQTKGLFGCIENEWPNPNGRRTLR